MPCSCFCQIGEWQARKCCAVLGVWRDCDSSGYQNAIKGAQKLRNLCLRQPFVLRSFFTLIVADKQRFPHLLCHTRRIVTSSETNGCGQQTSLRLVSVNDPGKGHRAHPCFRHTCVLWNQVSNEGVHLTDIRGACCLGWGACKGGYDDLLSMVRPGNASVYCTGSCSRHDVTWGHNFFGGGSRTD